MSKLYLNIIMMTMSLANYVICQEAKVPIKFWGLQSINGIVGAEGEYKTQDMKLRSNYSDNLKSSMIVGKFALNTQSYFYHPNLISIETEMEYNPGTSKDQYLVMPDRSVVNTGERLRGLLSLLRTQSISVTGGANYAHLYSNREYATNVETFNTGIGGGLLYRNNYAPISVYYQKEKVDQKELQTARQYLTNRQNIRAHTELSIGNFDENKLTYNFDDYERQYYSSSKVTSSISSVQLNSIIKLDSLKMNAINSNIYYSINRGNFDYNRVQVNENLNLQIPGNFLFNGNYSFFDFDQREIKTTQHTVQSRLEHNLYKSLRTQIYYEYINSNQTFSEEITKTYGIGFSYNKNIPSGHFSLSYDFRQRNFNNNNLAPSLIIINEEHALSNNDIILLNHPYIEINSIRVKDITGSIFYQENLDYLIIERNNFIEIQRLPGGLISEGSSVYIDYKAAAQISYEYGININSFSSTLTLFNNFVEVYFRLNENSYHNIVGRDASILKSISQRVWGSKINYNQLSAGIEIDDYNSNIIPYESTRYFLTISTKISGNFNLSFTGNQRFIKLINENERHEFRDFTGRLIYNISTASNLTLESSYRFQRGKGLDLDLAVIRGELKTQYRAIYLTFGIEGYNRQYISEKLYYWGSFVRIERKF